ncbi:MAG: hydrogenase maturation protease [Polyangiaceae bacterium]|nr:hydrogenase maturation protease [Polyangiaceae bacterium]
MSAVVLCVGNELAADDGIGIRVGRVLARLVLPPHVRVELRRAVGFDVLDLFERDQHLIIVDAAVTGQPPGTCFLLQRADLEQVAQAPVCVHGVGIPELLQIATRMQPDQVPRQVDVVSVEAGRLDRFTTVLSPAVREALPCAVAHVLRLLGADSPLLQAGEQQARQLQPWDPDPLDALGG